MYYTYVRSYFPSFNKPNKITREDTMEESFCNVLKVPSVSKTTSKEINAKKILNISHTIDTIELVEEMIFVLIAVTRTLMFSLPFLLQPVTSVPCLKIQEITRFSHNLYSYLGY
jgi:hypothetical protein